MPRNQRVAPRLPWAHRPEHGEVLVLCYHAVSDSWPSPLAVTTEQLRSQLTYLLDRGYTGATFSDAVLAPAAARVVAVTFDDGYDSLLRYALPILDELGLPATVFMPTGLIGRDRPMSWPGIEQWLGGPDASELDPLDLGRGGETRCRRLGDRIPWPAPSPSHPARRMKRSPPSCSNPASSWNGTSARLAARSPIRTVTATNG